MKLKDKVAMITGGSRGIGAAIAKAYAKEGATVIIINKNHPEDGREVEDQIKRGGGRAEAMTCDVCDPIAIQQLVATVIDAHHRIDVLVHCAGVLVFKSMENHALEDWDFVMNTNLRGPFLLSRAVIPYMKEKQHGKIIFISSLAAFRGIAGAVAYSASKGGLSAMVRSMVAELAGDGINVNMISPGFTATPMNQELRHDPHFMAQIKKPPSGESVMSPERLAGAAVYLASEDAKCVHGLDLVVDGGATVVQ